MSETKWTPGPWAFDITGGAIYSPIGEVISDLDVASSTNDDDERDANSHLIAAAPELYEALEEALDLIDQEHGSLYSDAQRKGRAALAKAAAK